ncbi:MAG: TRAP transporter large permease [Planctomycetes bacterium]|nr:TRAP transporter large permease [Planctomycetota bacterium]
MTIFALMFITLFILLFLGIPVGISMIGSSFIVLWYQRGFDGIPFDMFAQRMLYGVDNFTLLAIPAFLLIGKLMNAAGITDRIFNVALAFFGHLRGGLGHVNVVASVIFAGMSGSAVADAGGLGAVELKAMRDDGYPEDFSLAITAASSTIGPIIPPSIPAVIYGALANASITKVFIGSIVPGLIMAGLMMLIISIIANKRNFPVHAKMSTKQRLWAIYNGILPILTPFIIIGGILFGVFTPTEASAVALFYCILISFFVYHSISIWEFVTIIKETLFDTAVLLFIISSSALYSWVLARFQVAAGFVAFLTESVQSPITLLLLVNLFLLLIGCFIDSVPALFLLTPMLMPLIKRYGIDEVHFGVMMVLNLMIGLVTPPVGTVLYTLEKVSGVSFIRIARAMWPFYIALFLSLIIITFVPQSVLWLPNLILK